MSFDIRDFLKHLSTSPGVYRMLNARGEILYVGKAKNLRKRVGSYFSSKQQDGKTQALVKQIASIEVTVTLTEREAFILECALIKQHRPRYNVLFRDDKSYPYLFLSNDPYPRLTGFRGSQTEKGRYFGPYPSLASVRDTLTLLQKIFPIRQCENGVFRSRHRPCLQYQIKRCSAPCVGYVTPEQYQEDVDYAVMFLRGKNQEVLEKLANKMTQASNNLQFEKAARLRDQLQALQQLQQQQAIHTATDIVADVIAIARTDDSFCVQGLFIRNGRVLGSKTFLPKTALSETSESVLDAFLEQFYGTGLGSQTVPDEIILSEKINIDAGLNDWLQSNKKVLWKTEVRGVREQWLKMAKLNAEQALRSYLASKQGVRERLEALQDALRLPGLPALIECFDVSHTQGEETVASCVVLDETGMNKKLYRRFNIKGVTASDDYAAMEQVLSRRYKRVKEENLPVPDIVLIDGGKGQLAQAEKVMQELQMTNVILLGVAKGTTRKPGFEQLFLSGRGLPLILPADHPALLLIQQIRDEAHRFAITGHRKRRDKKRHTSALEGIPGVGPRKRQALLRHFGGWQGIKQASVEELCKVKGISVELAEKILAYEP